MKQEKGKKQYRGGHSMGRVKGSRNTLIRITYDTIGELASGITGDTARQYAQRGQFDPRNLDSLLAWVNARRTMKGLPTIGRVVSDEDLPITSIPPPEMGAISYDPRSASFRESDE
jgi:hypothetical protein